MGKSKPENAESGSPGPVSYKMVRKAGERNRTHHASGAVRRRRLISLAWESRMRDWCGLRECQPERLSSRCRSAQTGPSTVPLSHGKTQSFPGHRAHPRTVARTHPGTCCLRVAKCREWSGFLSKRPRTASDVRQRVGDCFARHGPAVIEPKRQQYFESTERFAHTSPVRPRQKKRLQEPALEGPAH